MILVDTHIWYWWVSGEKRLSIAQATALAEADRVGLSAISVWELCTKIANGKMSLDRPIEAWLEAAIDNPRLTVIPVTYEIVVESSRLPGEFHKDPADRMSLGPRDGRGVSHSRPKASQLPARAHHRVKWQYLGAVWPLA